MTCATTQPWPIRSVVFDLDGLLVDTEPIFEEAACRLLARRGLAPVPEVLRAMMGVPARQALEGFRQHYRLSESIADLATESAQLFFEVLGQQPAPLMPGVRELLDRLESRGIPKAIATSSTAYYVERILQPHHLQPRFAFVLTCDDVRLGKPFPEIYEKAVTRFGHAATEMLVFEDSPNGLRAAKAAGTRCIVVPHCRVPLSEITRADAILPSLAAPELTALLGL